MPIQGPPPCSRSEGKHRLENMTREFTVMIVEDDFHVASINEEIIRSIEGFQVVSVQLKGRDALDYLEEHPVDLALVDVYLPDISGLELSKEIREREYNTDIILITAASDGETVMKAVRAGTFDYIMKPFSKERLIQALDKYRNYRLRLDAGESIPSSAVDSLMQTEQKEGPPRNLDKGISSFTLQKVEEFFLVQNRRVTIQEMAEKLNLSRITARRYLEYLHNQGEIQKSFEYSDVGRPHAVYSSGIRD